MALSLGSTAPDFTQKSSLGDIHFINISRTLGAFSSHPKDFTPVCTTELGTVSDIYLNLQNEMLFWLSLDDVSSHQNLDQRHQCDTEHRSGLPNHRR